MVMDTLQVRLSHGIVEKVDDLVERGMYANRSYVIRNAVRRLILDKLAGIIPDYGDSVKEVRKLRKKLSKEKLNVEEINTLAK